MYCLTFGAYCSHFVTILDLYPVWLWTIKQDRTGYIHLLIHKTFPGSRDSKHDETRAIIHKSPSRDFFTNLTHGILIDNGKTHLLIMFCLFVCYVINKKKKSQNKKTRETSHFMTHKKLSPGPAERGFLSRLT